MQGTTVARLPIPGGDEGNWGQILNDFLAQTLKNDGTIKDNVIPESSLAAPVQAKINTVAGQQGATGPAGATGPQGPAGTAGATGAAGPAGVAGAAGATGPQGTTGAVGATGASGSAGAQGATGPAGSTGAAGSVGATGAQGATGPAGAGSTTDLTFSRDATTVTVESSTGLDAILPSATTTNAGVMAASDKTKLDGVAQSATANATDAQLRDRSTHTGTQAVSTITGLQGTLDGLTSAASFVATRYNVVAVTNTAYTLSIGDSGSFITASNASAMTITIPTNASVAFDVGTKIMFVQMGAGQVTFVASGGVSLYADPGLKIAAQYGGAELVKIATDTWILVGRLAA